MADSATTEKFPDVPPEATPPNRSSTDSAATGRTRSRTTSFGQAFLKSNPPLGMWQATGEIVGKAPTLPEIKKGAFDSGGWSHEGQLEDRNQNPHDIHRRRLSRSSTASRRTSKSAYTPKTPGALDGVQEGQEYFPRAVVPQSQMATEAERVPSTIKESPTAEAREQPRASESEPTGEKSRSRAATIERDGSPVPVDATHTTSSGPDSHGQYPNGYRFPKKHTWAMSTKIGLTAFWKFFCTPFGFAVTIYGLNVVGWGAMIFFVLLNAAPAMCHPSCNDLSSPRKKWIEIDSQVLNALFCVTGFGLIPWRFRDFYYLIQWRVMKKELYFRKLAGVNRGWFRLPGSQNLPEHMVPPPKYTAKNPDAQSELPPLYSEKEMEDLENNPAIPYPPDLMPEPPLTGVRARPSKPYILDVVVWMYLWNTIFQGALAGCMWGLNRFNRPNWTTGLFISIASVVAIVAGIVSAVESHRIKKIEGIPVFEYDTFDDEDKHTGTEKTKGHHWFTRH